MRKLLGPLVALLVFSLTASSLGGEQKVRVKIVDGKAVLIDEVPESITKAVAAANRLVGKPYKWGGGHGEFEDTGYDCSGAASYVLREAGLMKGSRASRGFFDYGKEGRGKYLTVWVRKGHVFLTIGGARFDTQGQTAQDGPRWRKDKRSKKKFVPRQPE